MKVMREIKVETDHFEVGDRIKVKLPEGVYTATAILDEGDNMLFIFDQSLNESMPMNRNGKTDGGYDKSDMRTHLQEVSETFPDKLKKRMVRFNNGDFLRLLTLQEMCGKDENFHDCEGQIPYMKQDWRHRITFQKGGENNEGNEYEYEQGWLSTVISDTYFALVNKLGNAYSNYPSVSRGVRPVFKLCVLRIR